MRRLRPLAQACWVAVVALLWLDAWVSGPITRTVERFGCWWARLGLDGERKGGATDG